MKALNIGSYTIFCGATDAGMKFKVKLSELIKAKFQEPYDETNIKNILNFCLDHYSREFETICQNEKSYEFYKLIFWLHEQSVELRMDEEALRKLNKEVGDEYFAVYRRILKLILEQACLINLVTEKIALPFKERTEKTFDDLMFLGDEIFTLATLLAEQDMIGDVVSMNFNDEGIYRLKRKREFELAFEHIVDMNAYAPNSFVIDKKAEQDFILAAKDSFNVDYPVLMTLLGEIFQHKELGKWDILAIGFSDIKMGMNKFYDVPEENTESFLSGLYFKKDDKIPIKKVVRKPFSLNRFLNRPILVWNIDDKDYCVIGEYSTREAISNLCLNAFPWNKAPKEWEANSIFKAFLAKKERQHEKMLIDAVEDEIKPTRLIYQPNIKNLLTKGGTVNIENDKCGEIDFLVINETLKKVFIIECKHLVGRYDMANFNMDFNSFTKGKDCFNHKIEKKVNWITSNLSLVEEHFQSRKKLSSSIIDFTVEGFFIINTPTFYMYFSKFRIYTYHEVVKVLTGKYIDKSYTLVTDDEESVETLFIKYPYFIKKKMLYYHDPYADYPVDKYGDPIIPEGE